jgi:hypothetical protein
VLRADLVPQTEQVVIGIRRRQRASNRRLCRSGRSARTPRSLDNHRGAMRKEHEKETPAMRARQTERRGAKNPTSAAPKRGSAPIPDAAGRGRPLRRRCRMRARMGALVVASYASDFAPTSARGHAATWSPSGGGRAAPARPRRSAQETFSGQERRGVAFSPLSQFSLREVPSSFFLTKVQ